MGAEQLLREEFVRAHPLDAARALEQLSISDAAAVLAELPVDLAAHALHKMAPATGSEVLATMPAESSGAVLRQLPMDDAAGLLRRLGADRIGSLLPAVPADVSESLRRLLAFPEGTAGALMDPQVLTLPADLSVGDAQSRVRRLSRQVMYYLYVVERTGKLVGVLTLRELLLASSKTPLATVMQPDVERLSAGAGRNVILAHPGWRAFHALPVIDDAGRFVGVLRHEIVSTLDADSRAAGWTEPTLATALAFGELCWSGLSKTLGCAASVFLPDLAGPGSSKESHHGESS
jgi:Mg/Co/Ni transporter MgtE